MMSVGAALDKALPGCAPGYLCDNERAVLFSCLGSFYLLLMLRYRSSPGRGATERRPPVNRIFFSEYVSKIIRRIKYVKANMSSRASEMVMFYGKLYCQGPPVILVYRAGRLARRLVQCAIVSYIGEHG